MDQTVKVLVPFGLNQIIKKLRAKVPDSVFRYALPLVVLMVLTGATYLLRDVLGSRNPVLGAVLVVVYIVLLLGAAWLGYGPGLLILLLITILPRFLGPTPRTFGKDAVRYALGAIICVLISRLGQTNRRREAELRHTAEELEIRVRERTESLKLQANLLAQINDAVLTVDRDFKIMYLNASAERLYGCPSREAVGQPYRAVAGTVVTQAEREAIHADIFNRGFWNGEIICTSRAGKQFMVSVSWSVLRDHHGHPTAVVGIHRDLTAPKQMEQALRESEDRLKLAQSDQKKVERANAQLASIVENADAAIISNDLAGVVLTWNRGAERIYGYSAEEMIGRTMAALVPPDRRAEDAAFMERLRRGERIKHVETIRLTKSGEPISDTSDPLADAGPPGKFPRNRSRSRGHHPRQRTRDGNWLKPRSSNPSDNWPPASRTRSIPRFSTSETTENSSRTHSAIW